VIGTSHEYFYFSLDPKISSLIFLLVLVIQCHKPLPIPKPVILQTPVNFSTLHQKTVTFQWQKVENCLGYHIQIDKKKNFPMPIINDSTLTDTFITLEFADGNYYWRVRGLSEDSVWGEWSATWSFKIERYRIISQTYTYGYAHDVFVDDDGYAYIADGQAGLTILNVEEPQNPAILANIMNRTSEAWGIAVEDNYAYLAYGSVELWIVDCSDLDSLYVVGSLSYPTPASGYALRIQDSLVYIAAMSQFIIASVADPRYPDLIFQDLFPANCRGVALIDTFAVIACEQLGIYIYNVANPNSSYITGRFDTPGNARDVFGQDSLAFIANGANGLLVVNIKDKNNPEPICSLDLPGYARKIYLMDNYLYIALGDSGLGILDISNPHAPRIEAIVKTGYAYSVFANEEYIYVACGRDGLAIITKEEK
jgi:hypothetical protein